MFNLSIPFRSITKIPWPLLILQQYRGVVNSGNLSVGKNRACMPSTMVLSSYNTIWCRADCHIGTLIFRLEAHNGKHWVTARTHNIIHIWLTSASKWNKAQYFFDTFYLAPVSILSTHLSHLRSYNSTLLEVFTWKTSTINDQREVYYKETNFYLPFMGCGFPF